MHSVLPNDSSRSLAPSFDLPQTGCAREYLYAKLDYGIVRDSQFTPPHINSCGVPCNPRSTLVKPKIAISNVIRRRLALAHRHARMRVFRLPAVWRGMLRVALSGLVFSLLNTIVRNITLSLDPFQSQFLRYLFGVVAMLPLLWRQGLNAYRPVNLRG
jgi:hypothetical protein